MTLTSKNYVDTNLSLKRDISDYTFNDGIVGIKQLSGENSILLLTSAISASGPFEDTNVMHVWRRPSGWTTLDIWGRIWATQESAFYGIDMRTKRIRLLNTGITTWSSVDADDAVSKRNCGSQFVPKTELVYLKEQVNRLESLVKSQQEQINKMATLLNI